MSNLAAQVQAELTQAVQNDELDLPTLPEVALRIRDAAEDDDVSVASLAGVISEDPGLAGRMIKVANSPLYRAAQPIEDLTMAVGRMGVEYAAGLATGMAMQQMFQATSDVIDRKLRKVWSHAAEVAGISSVLAKTFTRLRADQAALAGLTHVIGVLPILSWAEENPSLVSDSMTLDKVIDGIHGALGTMILQSWGFPEEIALVPAQYTKFSRKVAEPDYIDVVMVANLQTLAGTSHPFTKLDWNEIHAFRNLGLDPNLESSEIEGFDEDVAAARDAFA
ncbi:MAG: HDOD domain-containing protein [Pseudomonadales bacterium]